MKFFFLSFFLLTVVHAEKTCAVFWYFTKNPEKKGNGSCIDCKTAYYAAAINNKQYPEIIHEVKECTDPTPSPNPEKVIAK